MRYTAAFLNTRVARRILLLFVVCALLPISVLGFVVHQHVSGHLVEQTRAELRQASKSAGMGILQRLLFAEIELELVQEHGLQRVVRARAPSATPLPGGGQRRFRRVSRVGRDGSVTPLVGGPLPLPSLDEAQREHLAEGNSVLAISEGEGDRRVLLVQQDAGAEHLVGEIDDDYLWGTGAGPAEASPELPSGTELCVLDAGITPLGCSVEAAGALQRAVAAGMRPGGTGNFRWETSGGAEQLAGYWSLFLKPDFLYPGWAILVSQPREAALQPLATFERTFVIILLLALAVVLVVSNVQIRQSMVPLEKLWEGTRRIANRDFSEPVEVDTDDEFGELAESFNAMAGRLERQFRSLATRGEIDRAILSTLDTEKVVETVLERIEDLVPCHSACVGVMGEAPAASLVSGGKPVADDDGPSPAGGGKGARRADCRFYYTSRLDMPDLEVRRSKLPDRLVDGLESGAERVVLPPEMLDLAAPSRSEDRPVARWVMFPIRLDGDPAGFLALGEVGQERLTAEDTTRARQVADQVGVALSNARLLSELDQMTWGALTALARAIDAKSHWTSGHSERVTEMSLRLGEELGLSEAEMEVLQRGAILHDIGKIGVPAAILDKEGTLSAEETRTMKKHPVLGARILEPIPKYADVIPIVLRHHERWDGEGYPDGLSGEEIPYLARVLAVPDAFDAITSARPYRSAMTPALALRHLERMRERHFDPEVVDAFVDVYRKMDARARVAEDRRGGSGVRPGGPSRNGDRCRREQTGTRPVGRPGRARG